MKKRVFFAATGACALLVVGLVLTATAAWRQGHGRPFGPPGPPNPDFVVSRMTEALGLSDDQATQVKAIVADEQSKTETYRTRMADLDKQIRDADANGQFDEAKVRALAAEQGQAMTEIVVERERSRSKIYAVLTPEQRTKAESMPGPPGGPHMDGFHK